MYMYVYIYIYICIPAKFINVPSYEPPWLGLGDFVRHVFLAYGLCGASMWETVRDGQQKHP